MSQRTTNTLLFVVVISLVIMIFLLIISQAGKGKTLTVNPKDGVTSQELTDHLKGSNSNASSQPSSASVTETNAPAVGPTATSSNLQTRFTKPTQARDIDQRLDRDIGQRLDRAGAKTGQIQISLAWDTHDDLDLHVYDPSGVEIWHKNKYSASRGELDVDMNWSENPTFLSARPVENIFWPKNGAPSGRYKVQVVHSKTRGAGQRVRFMVRLKINDKVQIKRGWVNPKGTVYAADFTFAPPPAPRR